ncbi:thioredoxin family protein [Xanthomonas theicola]|uniref:Thioredoxin n=1 Tax=Xanthomonas theicola TaxID=56464 RepID=A0A2S6ZCF6_9XANT|nr:thioredoxin domain-containing protein [Xanthomonas theicola]PPT87757.1 thiol reductase thioredoxin [Xanthomonas theicola]QNH23919.1 thioredoxin fold domain-containing protein [Xanthomonas theicola]
MSDSIQTFTDASLEPALAAGGVLLLDFWAEWCAPCRALAPVLDDIADEYAGAAAIGKINADQNPTAVARYGVRGLPTLLLLVDGVERGRIVGLSSRTRIAALLDAQLDAQT